MLNILPVGRVYAAAVSGDCRHASGLSVEFVGGKLHKLGTNNHHPGIGTALHIAAAVAVCGPPQALLPVVVDVDDNFPFHLGIHQISVASPLT